LRYGGTNEDTGIIVERQPNLRLTNSYFNSYANGAINVVSDTYNYGYIESIAHKGHPLFVTGSNTKQIPLKVPQLEKTISGEVRGENIFDSGISVNGGNGAKTITVKGSINTGTGNLSGSFMSIIRCGYDGNNITHLPVVYNLGGSTNADLNFTVSACVTLELTWVAGNAYYYIESNRV